MAASVDPFLLVLTLVLTILLIIANIYIVAHYSHAVDSAFSSSMACKFVIVFIFLYLNFILIDSCIHVCRMSNVATPPGCREL